MNTINVSIINEYLASYQLPDLGQDLVSAKAVKAVTLLDGIAQIEIELGYPCEKEKNAIKQGVENYLQKQLNIQAQVNIAWKILEYKIASGVAAVPNVKNIIAVASGKGGVGKSTTAVNLALALQAEGASVAILDADIYGPSIPTMLGVNAKPESIDGKTIEPLMSYGLQFMSIGCLVDPDQPMIWRGPIVSKTLQQIIQDTNWRNVDYLVIDLPPGTGDAQLTMAQKIPVTGGLIVTTPQDIALQDAKRGLQMFNKVNIPVLGIVENMSIHRCSNCDHEEAIFGEGGGERFAQEYRVPLLGQLPLVASIRADADAGKPTMVAEPNSTISDTYRAIARQAAARLSLQGRDYSRKFPKINIQS